MSSPATWQPPKPIRFRGPGRLRRLWNRIRGRSTYQIVVQVGGDGFVPAIQFAAGISSLENLLRASSWAYACITMNSEAVATLPPIIQRRGNGDGEDEWIRDRSSATARELERFLIDPLGPAPQVRPWPWSQVIETMGLQYLLAGNSYWRKIFANGERPIAINPFPTDQSVVPEAGETGWVDHYLVGGSRKLDPDKVLHIFNASPSNILRGQSPMATALNAVNIDGCAVERQRYNLENRIAPGLLVKLQKPLGDKEAEAAIKELNDNFKETTKDGKPMVISEDVELIPMPDLNYQLNFFEARRFAREEILAVFHTPPPLVGDLSAATLQNFDKSVELWWSQALFPMAGTIYDTLNRQFVWPFYGPDVRIWYDVTGSPIGLRILSEQIAVAKQLVDLGYPTNMAARRVALAMPHVPELDQANVNLALAGRDDAPAEE